MTRAAAFDMVGFDADDTLWRSEERSGRPRRCMPNEQEVVHDHGGGFVELASITELPDWLAAPA
ncbi:MAG: hypothetical protein WKF60_11415 [Ilumatobacter sp.]